MAITWSLNLPYKPYHISFARIFLIFETTGLLDSRVLYAIQYNVIQHNTTQLNTTQRNTIQYDTIHNILSWEFKLPGVKTVPKIERYTQRLRIYGR